MNNGALVRRWKADIIPLAAALAAALPFAGSFAEASAKEGRDGKASKPNILFILTDDQGQSSLGCYGGGKLVPTPNIDRIAAEGIRFDASYVAPQCSPTRIALLTGRHPARSGGWHVLPGRHFPHALVDEPPYSMGIERGDFMLSTGLRNAGYTTGIAGKWHASPRDGGYGGIAPPAADYYGFDFSTPFADRKSFEFDRSVDYLTDEAIGFITRNKERPWFLYLCHHAMHDYIYAPPALAEKYRKLGFPDYDPSASVSEPDGRVNNAQYLALLEHLDASVGRLLTALEETGQDRNTVVVFLTDNGGVDRLFEYPGRRGIPADGSVPLQQIFCNFSSAPLRAGKGSLYEGGVRVPCLIRWPEKIRPGQVVEAPVHMTDWMPTLFSFADATPPEGYRLDGVNLAPLLIRGESLPERSIITYAPLYSPPWLTTPGATLRRGD
jgi:uncharacterized sulfatase